MVLVPLCGLAAGCNAQRPTITFRLNPETGTEKESLSDLSLPPPQLSATPSRWEYKVVKAQQDGEQELTKFLNELGREGWEFVGQMRTKESYLVLRRPKAPRDYIRSRGDLTAPPDFPGDIATGRLSPGTPPRRRATFPATAPTPPPAKAPPGRTEPRPADRPED